MKIRAAASPSPTRLATAAQDLVVVMVDNPAGLNRGCTGSGMISMEAGTVTGGWTPWIDIPDWFSDGEPGRRGCGRGSGL